MTRLNDAALKGLPAEVARPAYDRSHVKTGVVHLGIGAFHRAHQAVVFDDAIKGGDLRWGVLGASLRSPGVLGTRPRGRSDSVGAGWVSRAAFCSPRAVSACC